LRLAESIIEADQRRVVKEEKLRARNTKRSSKRLAEIEDERLADISLLYRLSAGRVDDLRRNINLDEQQKEYLRESLAEIWGALIILHESFHINHEIELQNRVSPSSKRRKSPKFGDDVTSNWKRK
jgi:hypothetical protein